jgi:hypothetical protein
LCKKCFSAENESILEGLRLEFEVYDDEKERNEMWKLLKQLPLAGDVDTAQKHHPKYTLELAMLPASASQHTEKEKTYFLHPKHSRASIAPSPYSISSHSRRKHHP